MHRRIDHLVLAARDLDAQARLYERLGFQVGAANRHAWGTLNRIVQFDGCFLELLTTEDGFERPSDDVPVAQFANPIADYLATREGMAMLVLASKDAAADQAEFAAKQIAGPTTFYFDRKGRKPDGTPVDVAFTLAFAKPKWAVKAGFFVCQQHVPEAFWNPAFQVHPNGARSIAGVIFQAQDAAVAASFLSDFSGRDGTTPIPGGHRVATADGVIDCLTPDAVADMLGPDATLPAGETPGFAGVRFAVDDLAVCEQHLIESGLPWTRRNQALVVGPQHAYGVALAFEQN